MAYSGFLIKIGSYTVPFRYIEAKKYKCGIKGQDLDSYREVLAYLISTTMHKIEGVRSFLIHVSKEDYPYVSMQKKQLTANALAPGSSVEVVEDATLGKNDCLIETENGIFDCGLGTQLAELRQKLKLLSYEKESN